jgi:hypothetical protein
MTMSYYNLHVQPGVTYGTYTLIEAYFSLMGLEASHTLRTYMDLGEATIHPVKKSYGKVYHPLTSQYQTSL